MGVTSDVSAGDMAVQATSDRALLLILLGVGGLLVALLVALPVLRRREAPAAVAAAAGQDSLVDALARLEIAHQAGEVSDAAYRDEKLRLKAQILDFVRKEGQA
jgi:Zn-dependent protease with chaperone function